MTLLYQSAKTMNDKGNSGRLQDMVEYLQRNRNVKNCWLPMEEVWQRGMS